MSDQAGEKANRYSQIIERIFFAHFTEGAAEVEFTSDDLRHFARELGIQLPANPPDVIYSFRYRYPLPRGVRDKAPEGKEWIIRAAGRGRYRFVASAREGTSIASERHYRLVPREEVSQTDLRVYQDRPYE